MLQSQLFHHFSPSFGVGVYHVGKTFIRGEILSINIKMHLLCRHAAVLVETIKKGIHDADAEARVEARK